MSRFPLLLACVLAWSPLAAGAPGAGDLFGWSVGLADGLALVGAPGAAAAEGRAFVFEGGPLGWFETAMLASSDPAVGEWFGHALDAGGPAGAEVLAIASPGEAGFAGAVHVLERQAGAFVEVAKPHSTAVPQPFTFFGHSLDLDAPSGRLAVGAPHENNIGQAPGRVYVFRDTGPSWGFEQKVLFKGVAPGDRFGVDVGLSDAHLVGGAPFSDLLGTASGTSAQYTRLDTGWKEVSKYVALGGAADAELGSSVALDGTTLAMGAPGSDAHGVNSGGVHVFDRPDGTAFFGCPAQLSFSAGGTHAWTLQAGEALAGQLYLVLGSSAGASPGLPVDGHHLPLALPDPYFNFTLLHANTTTLIDTLGTLDGAGRAQAGFELLEGTDPGATGAAGLEFTHAFVTLDLVTGQVGFASNAVLLKLVP